MTDRELLELAAKAGGYTSQGMEDGWMYLFGVQDGWNPLTDDGDALRLAVELQLEIGFPQAGVVWSFGRNGNVCREIASGDLLAATRRAIVRAAAEIGRAAEAIAAPKGTT